MPFRYRIFSRPSLKEFIVIFLIISLFLLLLSPFDGSTSTKTTDDVETTKGKVASEDTILILAWANGTVPPEGDSKFRNCEFSNCVFTKDRSKLSDARAVYIKTARLGDYENDLPATRRSTQYWVLKNREAPPSMTPYEEQFNNKFNLIINYRSDSDIQAGYGYIEPRDKDTSSDKKQSKKSINYAKDKSGLVAWIVSNCETQSLRERYVEELSKYIPVHIYGGCGNLSIDESVQAAVRVKEQYKFYLAFENSLCKEYASEKLWDTLNLNTVPIVLGAADYSRIIPPSSYINVLDYPSVKTLASYLQYLNKNDTEYNKYFEWKEQYVIRHKYQYYCKLCEHLNKHPVPEKLHSDLHSWLNVCKTPKEFYKDIGDISL